MRKQDRGDVARSGWLNRDAPPAGHQTLRQAVQLGPDKEIKIEIQEPFSMKSVFRNAFSALSRSLNPNPYSSFSLPALLRISPIVTLPPLLPSENKGFWLFSAHSSSMAEGGTSSVEKQFESFRCQLEETGDLRERVRAIAMEIESATRLIHANLLLVHQFRSVAGSKSSAASIVFEFFFF